MSDSTHPNIQWSGEPVLLRELPGKFGFPLIVKIRSGWRGDCDHEVFGVEEVYRLHCEDHRRRVIAVDQRKNHWSFPLHMSTKFLVTNKQDDNTPKYLENILTQTTKMPSKIQFAPRDDVLLTIEGDSGGEWAPLINGTFRPMDIIRARFFKANKVVEGIVEPKVYILPAYLHIMVDVALGFDEESNDVWQSYIEKMSEDIENRVNFDMYRGNMDIKVYSFASIKRTKKKHKDSFYELMVPRTVSIKSLLDKRRQEKPISYGSKVNEDENTATVENDRRSSGQDELFSSLNVEVKISRDVPKTLRDLPLPPLPPPPDLPLPSIPPEETDEGDNMVSATDHEKNNMVSVKTLSIITTDWEEDSQNHDHEIQPQPDERPLSVALETKDDKSIQVLEAYQASVNPTSTDQDKVTPVNENITERPAISYSKTKQDVDVVEDVTTQSSEDEDISFAQDYDEEILYAVNDDTLEQIDDSSSLLGKDIRQNESDGDVLTRSQTKIESVKVTNGESTEDNSDNKQTSISENINGVSSTSKYEITERTSKETAERAEISGNSCEPRIEEKPTTTPAGDIATHKPIKAEPKTAQHTSSSTNDPIKAFAEPKTPQNTDALSDTNTESSGDNDILLAQERDEDILYAIDDGSEYFPSSIRRSKSPETKSKEVVLSWSQKPEEITKSNETHMANDAEMENKNKLSESSELLSRDVQSVSPSVDSDNKHVENQPDVQQNVPRDSNPYRHCQASLREMKRPASESDTYDKPVLPARSRKDFFSLDGTSSDLLEDQEIVVIGRSWVPGEPEQSIAYF